MPIDMKEELKNKPPLQLEDMSNDPVYFTLTNGCDNIIATNWTSLEWAQARMLMLYKAYDKIQILQKELNEIRARKATAFFGPFLIGFAGGFTAILFAILFMEFTNI
jgi:hypothetical protein